VAIVRVHIPHPPEKQRSARAERGLHSKGDKEIEWVVFIGLCVMQQVDRMLAKRLFHIPLIDSESTNEMLQVE
jgi:hypothetical protein